MQCIYHSPYGEIISNWQKSTENSYRYEMKIPSGSAANVKLPVGPSKSISVQKDDMDFDAREIEGLESGSFKLNEGSYIIIVSAGERS